MRHRRLPEPFVFYIDECLGRHVVPDALRPFLLEGETIKFLEKGTLDEDWLPQAGERWLSITKDRALRRRPNEIEAIRQVGAGIFLLGEASGAEHARRLLVALPVVRRLARQLELAFIARIEPEGRVVVLYEAGKRLSNPRQARLKAGERLVP